MVKKSVHLYVLPQSFGPLQPTKHKMHTFPWSLPRVWSIFFIPSELGVVKVAELHLQVRTDGVPGQHGHRELRQGEGRTVPQHRVPHVTDLQHGAVPPRLRVWHRVGHFRPVVEQLHCGEFRGFFLHLLLPLFPLVPPHLLRLGLALDDAVGDASQDFAQLFALVPKHLLVDAVQREADGELGLPGETPHHGGLHPAEEATSLAERTRREERAPGKQCEGSAGEVFQHEAPGGPR